jgi:hypothetical protein
MYRWPEVVRVIVGDLRCAAGPLHREAQALGGEVWEERGRAFPVLAQAQVTEGRDELGLEGTKRRPELRPFVRPRPTRGAPTGEVHVAPAEGLNLADPEPSALD